MAGRCVPRKEMENHGKIMKALDSLERAVYKLEELHKKIKNEPPLPTSDDVNCESKELSLSLFLVTTEGRIRKMEKNIYDLCGRINQMLFWGGD